MSERESDIEEPEVQAENDYEYDEELENYSGDEALGQDDEVEDQADESKAEPLKEVDVEVERVPERYAVFISYRPCDRDVAAELYDQLTFHGLRVFMDYYCLEHGTDYAKQIALAMASSDIVVPILSRESVNSRDKVYQNFESLVETSRPDQLLVEYRLALELLARKCIYKIHPVFVGDIDDSGIERDDEGNTRGVRKYKEFLFEDVLQDDGTTISACMPQYRKASELTVVRSVQDVVSVYIVEFVRRGLVEHLDPPKKKAPPAGRNQEPVDTTLLTTSPTEEFVEQLAVKRVLDLIANQTDRRSPYFFAKGALEPAVARICNYLRDLLRGRPLRPAG